MTSRSNATQPAARQLQAPYEPRVSTCGLANLSAAFTGIRKQCAEWKYRAMKAEAELDELRMTIHQFAASSGAAKETARSILRSIATERHILLLKDSSALNTGGA